MSAVTDNAAPPTVLDVVNALDRRYPRDLAESWDRVGLVLGDLAHPVSRVLCVVDCVPETVDQALSAGADLMSRWLLAFSNSSGNCNNAGLTAAALRTTRSSALAGCTPDSDDNESAATAAARAALS